MVPVAQFGTQLFSHTRPVPTAAVVVRFVQASLSTPMPLSAHAMTMLVGLTVDCCPSGGGDVHSQMTAGSVDDGAIPTKRAVTTRCRASEPLPEAAPTVTVHCGLDLSIPPVSAAAAGAHTASWAPLPHS